MVLHHLLARLVASAGVWRTGHRLYRLSYKGRLVNTCTTRGHYEHVKKNLHAFGYVPIHCARARERFCGTSCTFRGCRFPLRCWELSRACQRIFTTSLHKHEYLEKVVMMLAELRRNMHRMIVASDLAHRQMKAGNTTLWHTDTRTHQLLPRQVRRDR